MTPGNVHRRAARRDANEPAIIDALVAAGATVEQWDLIDLVVGYRGRTYLMEVTNPENMNHTEERIRKAKQADWRRRWNGQAVEVFTPDDALRVIGAIKF